MHELIKLGDLCLATDPELTGVQECTAVRLIGPGERILFMGKPYVTRGTAWEVSPNLQYQGGYVLPWALPRYLIKLGDNEVKKDEKVNHSHRRSTECVQRSST